jgi:cell division protein FtsA
MDEVNRVLKGMGFAGAGAGQVVFTGGGAELAGLADFAQGALGRPVRVGRPMAIKGLPEAHATPGFSTLAGWCSMRRRIRWIFASSTGRSSALRALPDRD